MDLHGVLYHVPRQARVERTEMLLKMFELWDRRDQLVKTFSGGMKRRLEIARGLLHTPKILFLDEPTLGLDPQSRNQLWTHVRHLNEAEGTTVFLTTHYMEEAEHLADRIVVLADGRIVAEGTPKTLGGRDRMTATVRFTLRHGLVIHDLPAELRPLAEPGAEGTTCLHTETPLLHVRLLADWAFGHGIDLPDLDVRRPTLEDVYLNLTASTAKETR
jgi:ABC-type multidrug transport system ATPase subunit